MTRSHCETETLAQGSFCAVEICTCGSLHLTICALTLRLQPAAAETIAATLNAAVLQLALRQLGSPHLLRLSRTTPANGSGEPS